MAQRRVLARAGDIRVAGHGSASDPAWVPEAPEAPDNTSVIGCDAANETYYQLYADERGVCRVFHLAIGSGELRLWREGAPFAQRFTGSFSEDGSMITGRWEIAEDGSNYAPDFDLIFSKR